MTTGSWCFTEILMSPKPCSSNSEASHSADSTRACGVALPYFSKQSLVQRARVDADPDRGSGVAGGSSDLVDFVVEGLDIAGIDANARAPCLQWRRRRTWAGSGCQRSPGCRDFLAIAGSASASSWLGTATRTT